ncbi:hypothetical protein LIER_17001 [Lithospermum erythrorhizon]|uniref:Uncharacterized protein n=1 Tax=Lithospermum erythrorhizon TaxID=34254 RepID=A0AAV3QAQ8_LITER
MYGNKNELARVQKGCDIELQKRRDFYHRLMPWMDLDRFYKQMTYFGDGNALQVHWMSLSKVGQSFVVRYNVVLVSYGSLGGITCISIIVPDGVGPPESTCVLGHLSGAIYFVLV